MHELISAAAGNDWSYGGSILTFAFPEILFIAVAATLYVLYSKPHMVPGHRYLPDRRALPTTPAVRAPGQDGDETGRTATAGGGEATAPSGSGGN